MLITDYISEFARLATHKESKQKQIIIGLTKKLSLLRYEAQQDFMYDMLEKLRQARCKQHIIKITLSPK